MDNITHSLVGVALADAMMGRRAARSQRPLVVGAGLIAANFPDLDLAYSVITPAPIGYLLHHRGHTHTVVGLGVLTLVLMLAYRWVPAVRAMSAAERVRLWGLIGLALGSHLAMDALNSYGVHPWYPVDNTWYFGDAVFIFEPSLWLILGVAVAWNRPGGMARFVAAAPIVMLLITITSMGIVPVESVAVLGLGCASFAWVARRMSPRGRASLALGVATLIIAALTAGSRAARGEARHLLQPQLRGRLVDLILTPNPSSPLCWGLIGIESFEASGEYVLWRGTLTLAPSLKAPTTCASHRFVDAGAARIIGNGRLALGDAIHQSLHQLRDLERHDCRVKAWLRFGRAPVIAGGQIFDLRFGERGARSFTHMPLAREAGEVSCPRFVPSWGMPRLDLLAR